MELLDLNEHDGEEAVRETESIFKKESALFGTFSDLLYEHSVVFRKDPCSFC